MPFNQFTVTGTDQTDSVEIRTNPAYAQVDLKRSVAIAAPTRGEDNTIHIELGPNDMVELVYDDSTTWVCSHEGLEELFPGQLAPQQRGADNTVRLPLTLQRPGAERGIIGDIALKVLNIFGRKVIDTAAEKLMTDLAKHLEEAHLKNDRGLFRVDANFGMTPFNASEWQGKTDPALLFIHGTNSSSAESFFNDLPSNGLWEYATRTYKSGILAFQHESLSKSPLRNAIDLIDALPENIELHIITHSRGGLVGEILARCSDDSSSVAFSEKEIDYLEKEGRDQDVKDIKELQQAYLKKRFKLSRFIRVACPAGGTTILSKRLDHFLNFSLHLIGVTTAVQLNPIFDATKNLLMAAVGQKDNLKVLPGLEAMNPDSPFINILNNQETVIQRPVIAISGNSKPSVNPKGLLIIAGRLFFMKQNDLVVNTDSMYAGSKRKNRLKYFFDSGTNVDHFHYFRNERTNAMIALALQTAPEDMPADFAEFERGGLVPGGEYYKGDPSGKRPIAVLLPGIMGSCIDRNGDRLWLKLLSMGFGSLMDLDMSATGISVKNIIETSYRRLGEALSTDYDVVTFAFDWRKSSQDAAALLDKQIRSLLALKQPIKVVAHSLGGVVVRDLMVFYPGTWQQLNASPNFQLVFLGSPLLGSFRILNVLMGEDSIIRTLSRIDLKHSKRTLLNMFSQFPGILGLLPLTNSAPNDFASANTWVDIAVAFGDATWPVPRDTVSAQYLSDFRAYRTSVIAAMPDLDFKNAVYIAGKGRETACGYRIDDINGSKELVFLSTGEGDESVTWDMGIPQSMIRDNNVYYVNHTHGDLSDSPDMFSGIKEILGKGRTSLFTTVRPLVRGEEKIFRKPQTADFDLSEAGIYRTLMGLSGETNTTSSVLPVKVSVAHGDLKYAEYPVLAGHFEYDSVLYAEKRIDQLLGGQLEERNKLGIYPGALGTCDVLLTYKEDGFQGAIIAGIGQQDKLTAFDLARTAEQAASKYLLIVNGRKKLDAGQFSGPVGLSSLIIGCGYGGLSIDNSIHSILQGVVNANDRITGLYGEKAKLIEEVEFIEQYQDRALGCFYAIHNMGKGMGGVLNILPGDAIRERHGSRLMVSVDQGKDWWSRITICAVRNEDKKDVVEGMQFAISTGAAREEARELCTIGGVIDRLIETISVSRDWSQEKAAAIFELLMPNDFKARLKRHGNIAWVLDKYTAGYPWELLQHKGAEAKPLCINAGMIRQLSTSNSRLNIEIVTNQKALVIGDPQLKGFLPQLLGAETEAQSVTDVLLKHNYDVTPLIRREQDIIVQKLMSGSYRIIHLAGHGIFNRDCPRLSGMVIGKDNFLTTTQIAQMSDTPDLVFVNCCYLGNIDLKAEEYSQARYRLAANIGTQLIENGVKAVVVAGWAVNDAAANRFAEQFYTNMFAGKPFGEAVRAARETIYNEFPGNNTWGAYQCYGNPFFRLRTGDREYKERQYVVTSQAEADLMNLESDMRTGDYPLEELLGRLEAISQETDKRGLRRPCITELEARIYKSLGKYDLALAKYEQLIRSDQGSYSTGAMDLYCNLRSKLLKEQADSCKGDPKFLVAEFDQVDNYLAALLVVSPTTERYNIRGSAWKRRTCLYKADAVGMEEAIRKAAEYYRISHQQKPDAYPWSNWIALENLLVAAGRQEWGAVDTHLPTIQQIQDAIGSLRLLYVAGPRSKIFQEWISPSNLLLANWLVMATQAGAGAKDAYEDQVVASYEDVWEKVGSVEDKLSDIQHLQLLIDALGGLTGAQGHFMIGKMEEMQKRLNALIK